MLTQPFLIIQYSFLLTSSVYPPPASSPSSALDEKQLIFELVKDICNDLEIKSLCHKILQNISTLTNADRCSLFLVKGDKEDGDNRVIVSTLFDVSPDSTLEQMEGKEEIRVPWGTGIVGFVASSGESVHIGDCYHDDRFSDVVDKKTGYKTRNMMCAPIHDIFGDVMGVAQVINKKRPSSSNLSTSKKNSCDSTHASLYGATVPYASSSTASVSAVVDSATVSTERLLPWKRHSDVVLLCQSFLLNHLPHHHRWKPFPPHHAIPSLPLITVTPSMKKMLSRMIT